ncbi:MAG: Alkaline phosphatase [uncultured Solirubrobacteraceae bacterium]|uniref:Alkaline phosphatase n=1 Tax=uncultured Solirubrobacteraceae bacterium TaxID=1162706 RepID=A0A6J4RL23_9ACTN|nr:MAG: Alkaline phosphatase [uncultured Solirubrobacteraceae bacterium]
MFAMVRSHRPRRALPAGLPGRRRPAAPRRTAIVLGLAVALTFPVASASGATIVVDPGGTLVYSAAAGRTTFLDIRRDTPGGTTFTLTRNPANSTSDTDAITPGAGCVAVGGGGATYRCSGAQRLSATLLDQADQLRADIPATIDAGDGDDFVLTGTHDDTLVGGEGDDRLLDSGGNNKLDGGAGDDSLQSGDGSDTVVAGDGNDGVFGDGGTDTVLGGGGDDSLAGGDGADSLSGGDGNDRFFNRNVTVADPSAGTSSPVDTGDTYDGGTGFDRLITYSTLNDNIAFTSVARDMTVTLDDQANDGSAGEADNVRATVEAVSAETPTFSEDPVPKGTANDTLVGSAGVNDLSGGLGNDRIDGGRGNDVLSGNAGDDTIDARDGFADFVSCGAGNDVANVDTLDEISPDCETVNRVDVGNANEDRPPAIALATPADNATLTTRAPTTLTASVGDDKGIARVVYLVNGRVLCAATVAPYSCAYQPRGADVGRTAITAIAIDTSQQTATVVKTVNVGLFAPVNVSETVTPGRDKRAPFRFTARGQIALPATVTAAQGCGDGLVSVQVKVGSKTVSTRRAKLSATCSYSVSVTFRDRKRFGRARALKFTARFTGNKVLDQAQSPSRTVRIR